MKFLVLLFEKRRRFVLFGIRDLLVRRSKEMDLIFLVVRGNLLIIGVF